MSHLWPTASPLALTARRVKDTKKKQKKNLKKGEKRAEGGRKKRQFPENPSERADQKHETATDAGKNERSALFLARTRRHVLITLSVARWACKREGESDRSGGRRQEGKTVILFNWKTQLSFINLDHLARGRHASLPLNTPHGAAPWGSAPRFPPGTIITGAM